MNTEKTFFSGKEMLHHYETEDYQPPKPRITTVAQLDSSELAVGDKIVLLDASVLTIFTGFTLTQSAISTISIVECLPDSQYLVGITDIVLQDSGRIITPAGITIVVPLDVIRNALKQTEAVRNDKPGAISKVYQTPTSNGLDYDQLAIELQKEGRVEIPIPQGKFVSSFRGSIQSCLRARGVLTSTAIVDNAVVVTLKENKSI
jgi:hypothetical protein